MRTDARVDTDQHKPEDGPSRGTTMKTATTGKQTSPEAETSKTSPETSTEQAQEQKALPEPEDAPRKPVPQQHKAHLFAEQGSVFLEGDDHSIGEAQGAFLKGAMRRRKGAGDDG